MTQEVDALIFSAMKDLWIMEGQINCLESVVSEMPPRQTILAMLRELRDQRDTLENAVEEYTGVDVAKARRFGEIKGEETEPHEE
jgi:hypothetical protein